MSTDTIIERSPQFDVDLREIRKHYDRLSVFYRLLWGEHLHHGYWENGESIGRAQIKLMEKLAQTATIPRGATVLDIGCGLGGSAFWLAKHYNCRVTGFDNQPGSSANGNRTERARKDSMTCVRFLVGGRKCLGYRRLRARTSIWIMESSEHFRDKPNFFERCALALKPSGVLAVCAWLRERNQPRRIDGKISRGNRSRDAERKP